MLNVSKTTLMRSCDKNMTEKIGIPDAVLMENAANAVAQSIKNIRQCVKTAAACSYLSVRATTEGTDLRCSEF